MRKILLIIVIISCFWVFSIFAKDEEYQKFFPIPIEDFSGGTNDLHLGIQLACLKGKKYGDGDLDPFRYPHCDLIKFVPFPYQRVDVSTVNYSGTLESEKLHEILHNVADICAWLYKKSSNKDQLHQLLQIFFKICEKSGPTPEIRRIGENMLQNVLGMVFIKSSISFDDIWDTLEREDKGYFKRDFESMGHFMPLDSWREVDSLLLGIGDYLFSEGRNILKKGDTHRQSFFSVVVPDGEYFNNYHNLEKLALTFRDHKLYYTISVDMNEDDHYITSQYELQKDKSWKLSDCFHRENICPKNEECKPKEEKLSLSQCENLGIKLITTLGE